MSYTVALHSSKSSVSVHSGGRIEIAVTHTVNMHSIYISN